MVGVLVPLKEAEREMVLAFVFTAGSWGPGREILSRLEADKLTGNLTTPASPQQAIQPQAARRQRCKHAEWDGFLWEAPSISTECLTAALVPARSCWDSA